MRQLVQWFQTGELELVEMASPRLRGSGALVATRFSAVSPGTERMVIDLARKSILGKAMSRPDLVRQVFDKLKRDGLVATVGAVRARLDSPIALGYSSSGVILEASADTGLRPGERVACAGGGYACHAEVAYVPKNLCVRVPEGVSDEDAAFATLGAVALQGVRQLNPTLGEWIAVIGLGLIGQLVVQALTACGCRVVAIDLDEPRLAKARELGASLAIHRSKESLVEEVLSATEGVGVDGAVLTTATQTNDPVELAAELCRPRGRLSVIGAVKLELPQRAFYGKELELKMSMSYGPGRYDPQFEEQGIDYPLPHVRWTETRNVLEVLRLCKEGRIRIAPLVTHRFEFPMQALSAYSLLTGPDSSRALGIVLRYPDTSPATTAPSQDIQVAGTLPRHTSGVNVRVGLLGAGNYAVATLAPVLRRTPGLVVAAIASASGVRAAALGRQLHLDGPAVSTDALLGDPSLPAVFVATPHSSHADLACRALAAGKHVYLEKPLAVDESGVSRILATIAPGQLLQVGFNRSFAPLLIELRDFFSGRSRPLLVHYRCNAGDLPRSAWVYRADEGGGRLIGESCHFVDVAAWLTDELPIEAYAAGAAGGTGLPSENAFVTYRLSRGSVASIEYAATGDRSFPKERIEVIGDGRVAVLEDFRTLVLSRSGKKTTRRTLTQDKGHARAVKAFVDAVRYARQNPVPLARAVAVTRATFAALRSLETGRPEQVGA